MQSADSGSYRVDASKTNDVAPGERADFWSEHIASYQPRMGYAYASTDDFHGETLRQRTDAYQLVKFRSDDITYIRTAGQVRRDPNEDYRLLLPVAGKLVLRQDDQEATVRPGAAGLLTFAAPFECLHDSSAQAFIMSIPAHEVDGPLNRTSPLATGLDLTTGLGRVVKDMVAGLHEERDTLSTCQFDAVSDRVVELLCMLAVGDDRPNAPGHLAEVEAAVRRYVREHAADPGLNGERLARSLGWSLRQVQLALQQAGTTPRELIREERLERVREALQSPQHQHLTITDLAYATGFSSPSALSTAFRQRFGMTPRELRHEGGP